jgi:hypothetical protein
MTCASLRSRNAAARAGCTGFIAKPVDAMSLGAQVAGFIA